MPKKSDDKDKKTNAMRILDAHGVRYKTHCYADTGAVDGTDVASALGRDPHEMFKTLVTVGRSGAHYVFMLPVCHTLDLKKAAAAVREKAVDMVHAKELLPLTGYVHGGCSPVGMKKPFPTVVDESAARLPSIVFSAGRIGWQVEMPLSDLQRVVPARTADIVAAD